MDTEILSRGASPFHCGAEVHLCEFHWLSLPIYLVGLRVSRKSRKFVANIRNLAEHFRTNRSSVWQSIADLKKSGFVVLTLSGANRYESSEYRVLTHLEWAEEHPNQCREKEELGYGDAAALDSLGRTLYAISGGYKIAFRAHRIAWYRKSGLSDDQIEREFRDWFPSMVAGEIDNKKRWRGDIDFQFGDYLSKIAGDRSSAESRKLRR